MAVVLLAISPLPALAGAVPARIGPDVVLLTLGAAVLHATWNAIAAGVADRLIGFAFIGIAYATVCSVAALVLGLPPRPSWAFIATSAAIYIAYQLLLASYQLGEFSQVYPLARGTSPRAVAVVSIDALGRELPVTELLGVLVISAGLISLLFLGGRPTRAQLPDLGAAFATGVCIAGYTSSTVSASPRLRSPPTPPGCSCSKARPCRCWPWLAAAASWRPSRAPSPWSDFSVVWCH